MSGNLGGIQLEPHERWDGGHPLIHVHRGMSPAQFMRANRKRGVAVARLATYAVRAIIVTGTADSGVTRVDGFTEEQWLHIYNMLKVLSTVMGEQ